MNNNLSKAYQDNLITIYTLVAAHEFSKAEKELLKKIYIIISDKTYRLPEVIQFIKIIYSDFNSLYFKWLSQSGARIRVQLSDLYTKEHDNYFIGNCSDPAAMDDLLYELIQCKNDADNSELNTHYECYILGLKKQGKNKK